VCWLLIAFEQLCSSAHTAEAARVISFLSPDSRAMDKSLRKFSVMNILVVNCADMVLSHHIGIYTSKLKYSRYTYHWRQAVSC